MDGDHAFKSEPSPSQHAETLHPPMKPVLAQETERPPSAQQQRNSVDESVDCHSEVESSEEGDPNPATRIVDFDWDGVHQRYHEAINECHNDEAELMQEWDALMTVLYCPLSIWAGLTLA